MKLLHSYLQLSQAQIIKLSLIIFLIFTIIILYLESVPPQVVSIQDIEHLALNTPISIIGTFRVNFESEDFSVITLYDLQNSNISTTAIIQTNASLFNSSKKYTFSGKVNSFRGTKQLDIYTMKLLE